MVKQAIKEQKDIAYYMKLRLSTLGQPHATLETKTGRCRTPDTRIAAGERQVAVVAERTRRYGQ